MENAIHSFEDLAQPAPREALPASYLTHELRAPVTAIRLGLEILQEQSVGRLAPYEAQMLELAVKNTKRLAGLIDDIMDYAKASAGKMPFHPVAADPRAMIAEAVDSIQSLALSKGLRLVKDGGEPLASIKAEPRRVVQILVNLLSNAVKFTPAGGRISVGAAEGRGEHRGTVMFKVHDSGCGIPQADAEAIFRAFEQSSQARRQNQGTGLGLSLAKTMVELHGGKIWVESRPGRGASFYFTIPVALDGRLGQAYAKGPEYHGLLVELFRRVNAFLAAFV